MNRPIRFRIFDLLNKRWLRSGTEHFTPVLDLGAWQDESRWAISQFTGLKGSKGVDIWEDDIIDNGNERGPVVFADGRFYIRPDVTLRLGEPRYMGSLYWDCVMGNQWEHPHLLT